MKNNRRGPEEKPGLDVLGPLQDIIRQVREGKITREELQAFSEHRNPFENKLFDGGAVRLFVDYTRPLAEMIKGCGFDWVNPDISEGHYPITKRPNGEVEMKLFHFNRAMESDEVIREMDKAGYRPAELPELLACVKAYPDTQWKHSIALLGSVWQGFGGYHHVPCLPGWGGMRVLNLQWRGDGWGEDARLLGVRK